MSYNSLDIMHYVILASILEPIPEKKGCTTRKNDWQNKSKLEYICAYELLGNTFKFLRKTKDKKMLEENWSYLNSKFPNWRKNLYIRRMPGIKNFSIKITNKFIYDLKSNIKW